MARIIIESGTQKGRFVDLPGQGEVDAGRDTARFIHIPDAKVSRRHFTVKSDAHGIVLEDHGSSNGTYVNGERVEVALLRSGDLIRVGDTFLSFAGEAVDPLIGRTVGGYLIQQRIGRGGMGTVYRALQISLERLVAFKVLSRALTEDREFVVRFLSEARVAAKLDHPNVVRVYDVGEDGGCFFLSMEHMPGGSVQDAIDREGPLGPERAIRLGLDAAKALVWASEKGIVHRDLKPDNLLVAQDGSVKVADFGLAADERKSKTLYAGGKVLGTPGYMAPEQALGKPVDHRADIYALGSTLYAALVGAAPYSGTSPVEVLLKKVNEPPRPLREAAPSTPPAVAAAVERMMAREPEDRYATAAEAHAALSEALAALREAPGTPARLAEALRSGLKRLRRR
ncbi:MAG: protein kinase [Planctomycetes bacterium]|nr:protein kinase [Planctomycetota bacterium]